MRDLPLFQRVKALQQQLRAAQDDKKQRVQYQYRSHAERIKHPKCGADFVLRHEAEAGKDGKCARHGCCVCDCPALLIVRGELQPKQPHSSMTVAPPPLNIPIDASRSSSSGSNAGGSSNLGGVVAIIPASGAQPAPLKSPAATTLANPTSAAAANDTNKHPDNPSPAELPTQPAAPADAVAGGTHDSTGALLPPQQQPSAAAVAVAAAAAAEGDITDVWPKQQQRVQQQPARRNPSAPGCLAAASETDVWHDCQGAHKPRLSAAAGETAAAGAGAGAGVVIDLDTWAALLKQESKPPASHQQPQKQQPEEDGGALPAVQLNRTRTGPGGETTDCDPPGRESGTPLHSGVSRVHALWRADEWAGSLVEMMIADRVLPPFKKARSPMQLAWRRVKKAAAAPVRLVRRLFARQASTVAVWTSEV